MTPQLFLLLMRGATVAVAATTDNLCIEAAQVKQPWIRAAQVRQPWVQAAQATQPWIDAVQVGCK